MRREATRRHTHEGDVLEDDVEPRALQTHMTFGKDFTQAVEQKQIAQQGAYGTVHEMREWLTRSTMNLARSASVREKPHAEKRRGQSGSMRQLLTTPAPLTHSPSKNGKPPSSAPKVKPKPPPSSLPARR
jgi:hypothetical protein